MTTVDPHVTGAGAVAGTGDRADGVVASVADWITTTDHKKIGRLFIGTVAARAPRRRARSARCSASSASTPRPMPSTPAPCRSCSRSTASVLTFGVVVPLGLGLAIAVVPLQLGARSLAFPRMAAAGFFTWLRRRRPGDRFDHRQRRSRRRRRRHGRPVPRRAASSLLLGLTAAAGSVAVSVLTTRAPGMNMRRVPLFSWSALVQSLGLVLALPVLVGTLVLRARSTTATAAATFGGNIGIGSWIGFAFTQPATFLYAVPVFGLVLDTVGHRHASPAGRCVASG